MIDSFKGRYWFLSNFAHCVIRYEDIQYPTTEHAFQAAKTTQQGTRQYISGLPSPREAKGIGRDLVLRDGWNEIRIDVMRHILKLKFTKEPFTRLLLSTGDEELVEGNTWGDTFWGVDINTGHGENNLGKLLMEIREQLRTADA